VSTDTGSKKQGEMMRLKKFYTTILKNI